MTVPACKIGSTSVETCLKALESIPWMREDPLCRYKAREIATRYVQVCRFLGGDDKDIKRPDDFLGSEECLEPKRGRISSDDSLVAEKQPRQLAIPVVKEEESAAPLSNEWECKKCTFLNSITATSCGICGWFKPRSEESTGTKPVSKRDNPVEVFIRSRTEEPEIPSQPTPASKQEDLYAEILSRGLGGLREQQLTGKPCSSSDPAECTVYASPFNLLASGQAQEESTWICALEKDVFAHHSLDEELLFTKRYLAAKKLCVNTVELPPPVMEDRPLSPEELEAIDKRSLKDYASACNSILGTTSPQISFETDLHRLTWEDWKLSGVHSAEFLSRLEIIHSELIRDTLRHYESVRDILHAFPDSEALFRDEPIGRRVVELLLTEPRCDLNMHCLSHVEGDNLMDRFLIPAAMERADLIFTALREVWNSSRRTGFVAARPPGHHCPSFEDRLIGLSSSSSPSSPSEEHLVSQNCHSSTLTKLEKQICKSNGLNEPPREHGMGFCALNALAVAVKRFLQIHNPEFERLHKRSIRLAILDLDIHAGNGTELVFRDNRSVLHVSFHRFGFLQGSERVMPGTHYYKDVGGIFGKCQKRPKGEGYAVNITLRKGDGNAEVLSAFEGIALPIMQEFDPDLVVVACGFDGLKLSPVFKKRWGEGSCPGMDAEYTPSLYGYIVNRVRDEVQPRVIAATEGGYDPLSVGLAARSVVRALKGIDIPKPPIRVFNSDWLPQLNNIFQLQQTFWSSLG